jgi:hypothetical protein
MTSVVLILCIQNKKIQVKKEKILVNLMEILWEILCKLKKVLI